MIKHAAGRLLRILGRPVRRGSDKLALECWPGMIGPNGLFVVGRVTRRQAGDADRGDSRGTFSTIKALFRHGVPDIHVQLGYEDATKSVKTDRNGYFTIHLKQHIKPLMAADARLSGPGFDEIIELVGWPDAKRFVISDIDDTVIQTGVANKWRMFVNMLMRGAEQKKSFAGTTSLFEALCQDSGLIMVSRGPWTIYKSIDLFFDLHGFPKRLLFLRDWGIRLAPPFYRRAVDHKKDVIDTVLDIIAPSSCILIGDSGQSDAELYVEIARARPEQIRAVMIRDVSKTGRDTAILKLMDEFGSAGIPFIYAEQSDEFRHEAARLGLIADRSTHEKRHQ